MKRINSILTLAALALLTSFQTANASQVIDKNAVYAPKINVCVSSFGGLIQSREIIVTHEAGDHITRTRDLLTRWIYDYNSAGFYLQEFEQSQFYWQFVETKKYVGAILLVTGSEVNDLFYNVMGSGLNVCGKEFYGLDSPANISGDLFSFVVKKDDYALEYFENWKFTEETTEFSNVSTAHTWNLLTNSERSNLNQVCKKSKGDQYILLCHKQHINHGNIAQTLKRDTLPGIDK